MSAAARCMQSFDYTYRFRKASSYALHGGRDILRPKMALSCCKCNCFVEASMWPLQLIHCCDVQNRASLNIGSSTIDRGVACTHGVCTSTPTVAAGQLQIHI